MTATPGPRCYVTPLRPRPWCGSAAFPWSAGALLFGDTTRAVFVLALRIGLAARWKVMDPMPHFRVTRDWRAKAVAGGAVELPEGRSRCLWRKLVRGRRERTVAGE